MTSLRLGYSGLLAVFSAAFLWTVSAAANNSASSQDDKDDVYCLSLHRDWMRRQSDEWGRSGPFTVDGKHTPFTTFDPETRTATIVVGNGDEIGGVYHPMVASDNPTTVHFITHIYAVDQNGQLFAAETMDPNMPAPAMVVWQDIPESVTELTAYEFCNLHGLWQGPTVSTISANSTTATIADTTDAMEVEKAGGDLVDESTSSMLPVCQIESPLSVAYDSFAADFVRRQALPPFSSLEPYNEDDGTKHTPYIHLHDNGTATVKVGVEGNYHVMQGTSAATTTTTTTTTTDDNENSFIVPPHWITDIYVVDQTGAIVTMQSLNPSHVDMAQIQLEVPASATTLTAYEWCNIHGLYVGPTVSATTGEILSRNTESESEITEPQDEEISSTEGEEEESSFSSSTTTTRTRQGMAVVAGAIAAAILF